MPTRVLPEARADLRSAIRHYRNVKPPALGKQLATKAMSAFREALDRVAAMPLAHPEHPDIPGARWVMFAGFPYIAFYMVKADDVVVVAVVYAARDYVARIAKRTRRAT